MARNSLNGPRVRLDSYAEESRPRRSPWLGLLVVAALLGLGLWWWWNRQQPYAPPQPDPVVREDMAADDPAVRAYAETLLALHPEGPFISNIVVESGIRTMDGEIPSPGEVKIMFNLAWHDLPGNPGQRRALDETTAHALDALMERHPEITKLRLVVKVPKTNAEVGGGPLGRARGHRSAAKLFSFTRTAWEHAPDRTDPASLLAFGDYVVLTEDGWRRGF